MDRIDQRIAVLVSSMVSGDEAVWEHSYPALYLLNLREDVRPHVTTHVDRIVEAFFGADETNAGMLRMLLTEYALNPDVAPAVWPRLGRLEMASDVQWLDALETLAMVAREDASGVLYAELVDGVSHHSVSHRCMAVSVLEEIKWRDNYSAREMVGPSYIMPILIQRLYEEPDGQVRMLIMEKLTGEWEWQPPDPPSLEAQLNTEDPDTLIGISRVITTMLERGDLKLADSLQTRLETLAQRDDPVGQAATDALVGAESTTDTP